MSNPGASIRITLRGALVGAVAIAILAGMVPAGIALHAQLARALEDRAHEDLQGAPHVLANWLAATNDALMMRAKDFAHDPALAPAIASGNRAIIEKIANDQRPSVPAGIPVIIGPNAELLTGPLNDSTTVAETRRGRMPVTLLGDSAAVQTLALAPVQWDGRWIGAAGFAVPLTDDAAHTFAGLSHSDVIIMTTPSHNPVASTLDSAMTRAILASIAARDSGAHERSDAAIGRERVAVVTAPLGAEAAVVFARIIGRDLAILPALRRVALISAVGALVLALILGALLANQVSRPVRDLAQSARALGDGNFNAPLPRSRLEEVATVSETFGAMRAALSARLAELQTANRELEDRAVRLVSLQSDMLQRERLAASAQLVGHLAHEIRNPVATLRNLLAVIERRLANDPEGREYAALAIDELLRMHELAERMLDLNRPRDPTVQIADVAQVARDVARLVSAGDGSADGVTTRIDVDGDTGAVAAIAPDALKQVLLNIVQNAREAVQQARPMRQPRIDIAVRRDNDTVAVSVLDNGPGISEAALPRIFDPFFTTKESVQGVGLGLFVAEGIVRTAGGRLTATNRPSVGAEFRVLLPVAEASRHLTTAPLTESV